jgi:2-polyprenyl-3-methyl-5-hydroxy-6-metoxy-1,4-benzoquinol methylase
MSDDHMASYYAEDFGGQRHRQGQIVNAKINAYVFDALLGNKPIKSCLDVGTGYGFFLKELRDRYAIETTGVEVSRQEAEFGKGELNLDIKNAMLSDAGVPKASFDLVTSFEVIEHVQNPREFVKELAHYVRPGGYLLIMTDNFESDVVEALGPGFPKWIPHSHISHFGPKTLESVVADQGLEIVAGRSYDPWEVLARNFYYRIRGIRKQPHEAFNLESTLRSEMGGKFRLFWLRQLFNKTWARLTLRRNLSGAAMFLLARMPDRGDAPSFG